MLHDERVYNNPTEFMPQRYEAPASEPDPARVAFGFGRRYVHINDSQHHAPANIHSPRRVCPGRFFADESVWLTVALMLHIFDISKPAGVPFKVEWSPGLIRFVGFEFDVSTVVWGINVDVVARLPSDFPFELSPRFPGAADLVAGFEQ